MVARVFGIWQVSRGLIFHSLDALPFREFLRVLVVAEMIFAEVLRQRGVQVRTVAAVRGQVEFLVGPKNGNQFFYPCKSGVKPGCHLGRQCAPADRWRQFLFGGGGSTRRSLAGAPAMSHGGWRQAAALNLAVCGFPQP